jgi:hypothetical protein
MARAVELMAELSEQMQIAASGELRALSQGWDHLPANWDTPKISKGENYLGLPYVMLDYPRLFTREHVLAIRTMFWWGHYFSATLHLSGGIKDRYSGTLASAWSLLAAHQFRIYVQEDPWEHDFGNGNYKLISAMQAQEFTALIYQLPFIKLAKPYQLALWEKIIPEVVMDYALLLQILVNK